MFQYNDQCLNQLSVTNSTYSYYQHYILKDEIYLLNSTSYILKAFMKELMFWS